MTLINTCSGAYILELRNGQTSWVDKCPFTDPTVSPIISSHGQRSVEEFHYSIQVRDRLQYFLLFIICPAYVPHLIFPSGCEVDFSHTFFLGLPISRPATLCVTLSDHFIFTYLRLRRGGGSGIYYYYGPPQGLKVSNDDGGQEEMNFFGHFHKHPILRFSLVTFASLIDYIATLRMGPASHLATQL